MLPVRIRRGRCALAVNAVVESEECESAAGAGMSMADDDDKAAVALARDFERSRGGDCGRYYGESLLAQRLVYRNEELRR